MAHEFEQLEVWELALDYTDHIYAVAEALPDHERYGLASQMRDAANSIALNIAEGSTGLCDAEQDRFLRLSTRPLMETVGTLHLVQRREYVEALDRLRDAYRASETLFAKLQAFRDSLSDSSSTVQEAGTTRSHPSDLSFTAQPADRRLSSSFRYGFASVLA